MEKSRLYIATGPESCGKSTLATQLCDALQAPLLPEISREYLNEKVRKTPSFIYQQQDLTSIAEQQHALENSLLAADPELIICDTDLLVLIIWSEFKYGTCDPLIAKLFQDSMTNEYPRHYFLCDFNIPWQEDPLRENPNDRKQLFEMYLAKLKHYQLNFSVVFGDQQQRLKQALDKHRTLY